MILRGIFVSVVVCLLASVAPAGSYTFDILAQSGDQIPPIVQGHPDGWTVDGINNPSIDDQGNFTYSNASSAVYNNSVLHASGIQSGNYLVTPQSIQTPFLTDQGTLAYQGSTPLGNGLVGTIFMNGVTVRQRYDLRLLAVNDRGNYVYGRGQFRSELWSDHNGPESMLIQRGDPLGGGTAVSVAAGNAALNNNGLIAYDAEYDLGTGTRPIGVFSSTGSVLKPGDIVDGYEVNAFAQLASRNAMNDAGTILSLANFIGFSNRALVSSSDGILARNGDQVAPDTVLNNVSQGAINEQGDVAYTAGTTIGQGWGARGGSGLFTVEDGLVLGTGDKLNGKTVQHVNWVDLNSHGDLITTVSFTDGSQALVVARNAVVLPPTTLAYSGTIVDPVLIGLGSVHFLDLGTGAFTDLEVEVPSNFRDISPDGILLMGETLGGGLALSLPSGFGGAGAMFADLFPGWDPLTVLANPTLFFEDATVRGLLALDPTAPAGSGFSVYGWDSAGSGAALLGQGSLSVSAVPLPSSAAMLAVGLVGLGLLRRYRRKAA